MTLLKPKSADRTERFRVFTGGVASGKTLSMIVSALELSKKTKLDIFHKPKGVLLDKFNCIFLLSGLIMKGSSKEASDFNRKYFTDYIKRLEVTNTYFFVEIQESLTLVPPVEKYVGTLNYCSIDITQKTSKIKIASENLITGDFCLQIAEVSIVVKDKLLNDFYRKGGRIDYQTVANRKYKSLVI